MIDLNIFINKLELLQRHFNRTLNDEVIKLWKDYFDKNLTTEEFCQAVDHILLHSRFFPTANELVEVIQGSREIQAHLEWQNVLRTASGNRQYPLSERAIFCVRAIGNIETIGRAEYRQVEQLQKQFISLYCSNYFIDTSSPRFLNPGGSDFPR